MAVDVKDLEALIAELEARANARHSGEASPTARLCARAAQALSNSQQSDARVREALEPFADFADFLASETEGFEDADELVLSTFDHEMTRFKFGDFRRARAALKAEEKG